MSDKSLAVQLSQLGRALGHPLRVQILTTLLEDGEASPVDISTKIDVPLGNVAYHVRYLVGLDVLELQRMAPRRGAVQHFYKLTEDVQALLPAAAKLLRDPPRKGKRKGRKKA